MKTSYIKPEIYYLRIDGKEATMDFNTGGGTKESGWDNGAKDRGFSEEELESLESSEKISLW